MLNKLKKVIAEMKSSRKIIKEQKEQAALYCIKIPKNADEEFLQKLKKSVEEWLQFLYACPVDVPVNVSAADISLAVSAADPDGARISKSIKVRVYDYRVSLEKSNVYTERCGMERATMGYGIMSRAVVGRTTSVGDEIVTRFDYYYNPAAGATVFKREKILDIRVPSLDFCVKVSFCVSVRCDSNYAPKIELCDKLMDAVVKSSSIGLYIDLKHRHSVTISIRPTLKAVINEPTTETTTSFSVDITQKYYSSDIQFKMGDTVVNPTDADHIIEALCISDEMSGGTSIDIGSPI